MGGPHASASARAARASAPDRVAISPATAVRASQKLEQVAVGILEVHAAPAVIVVDLAAPGLAGVGPVVELSGADAAEDVVEVVLGDQEGVVLRGDVVVALVEIERDVVVDLDHEEGAEGGGRGPAEDIRQEGRRSLPV